MTIGVELDDTGSHIIINADWRYKELCKSLPGASFDGSISKWKVPVSWSACLALRSTFKDDLVLGDALKAWAANERATRIDPSMALRDLEVLPDGEVGNEDLFSHQRVGVRYLATAKRALLADEPGLGKTAQAIRGLKQIQENGDVY